MIKRFARTGLLAGAAVTMASMALVGCGGSDESADDETTTTEAETTTTEAPETTAAPETAVPETTAPAADEVLVFPTDHTARIAVDTHDATGGDTVTATVTGFAPGAALASSFIASWPPTDMPDPDHFVTYLPDVAVADATGAATVAIVVDPVCGVGDCYMVVADGIGPNGIYAGVKLNYQA